MFPCLPAEYEPFICTASKKTPCSTCYDVAALECAPACFSSGSWLWQNELLRLGHTSEGQVLIKILDVMESGWHDAAILSGDLASGTLFPFNRERQRTSVMAFHHPHDRVIIIGRLAHLGGGLIHASCVVEQGKALLFVGPSGAGKTTISRLWRQEGATILNDERNIVRTSKNGPQAGSSPWHGEENEVNSITAPLAAVFYLKQAPTNSLRDLACAESVARLLTATFIPVFIEHGPQMILDSWGKVLEAIPSYELSFIPDKTAIEVCRSVIAGL